MCVMKIPVATVLILLITSPPTQSKKYDDDISPGKVNLEDIEDSHIRAEKKLQLQLQKTKPHNIPTKPPNLTPPTFSTQHDPQKTTPSHINHELASQRVQPLDRSSSTFVHNSHSHRRPSDYEMSAAQHHSIGVPSLSPYAQFVHSENNEDDSQVAINENELQQQQQQQPVFAYSHEESQFADANSYQREQQQQQQQQDYIQILPQYDQIPVSNNRQHQQQKELYMMTPSTAPSPAPARLPPRSPATSSVVTYPLDDTKGGGSDGDSGAFQQQPQQPHTPYLQYGPPGIQYLTSNVIHASTLLNPVRGMSIVEYSHERANSNADKHQAIEYGNPEVVFRRPQYGQSNQRVYAPKRPTQSNNYNTMPFPPSFISITTERPSTYADDTANEWKMNVIPLELAVRPQYTSAPVPDIFAGRQAKSLLDSYIPSWLVTKMQELNIRPYLPLSNQISDVDYDYSNNFKRSATTTTRHKQKQSAAEELMITS